MSAIDRLYSINNKTVKKSINIDDSLYKRLMRYTKKNYDATISDMINVCIEDLLSTGSVKYGHGGRENCYKITMGCKYEDKVS